MAAASGSSSRRIGWITGPDRWEPPVVSSGQCKSPAVAFITVGSPLNGRLSLLLLAIP